MLRSFLLTLIFMPDPLRVSLTEVDRRWAYIRAGKEYHGEAINPWNLSFFERWIGHGRTYNRAKDEEDRQAPELLSMLQIQLLLLHYHSYFES